MSSSSGYSCGKTNESALAGLASCAKTMHCIRQNTAAVVGSKPFRFQSTQPTGSLSWRGVKIILLALGGSFSKMHMMI